MLDRHRAARNFLIHAGILAGEIELQPTVNLNMLDGDCYVFAEHDGLIEPLADLGEPIEAGQVIARIWPVDRTGVDALVYRAKRAGMLAARHFPGLVKTGDCLAVVAVVE